MSGGDSGMSSGGSAIWTKQYEIACSEGLGYMITTTVGASTDAITCLEQDSYLAVARASNTGGGMGGGEGGMGVGGGGSGGMGGGEGGMGGGQSAQTIPAGCQLPANSTTNQFLAMTKFSEKAGIKCGVSNARGIGHNNQSTYFEIACDDETGYVLQTGAHPDATQPVKYSKCEEIDASTLKCQLSDPSAAALKKLTLLSDTLVGKAAIKCQVTDRRFVGQTNDGGNVVEVSCTEGTGYVLAEQPEGKAAAMTCKDFGNMAGGCQLAGNKSGTAAPAQ
jgi:hypothetical protein